MATVAHRAVCTTYGRSSSDAVIMAEWSLRNQTSSVELLSWCSFYISIANENDSAILELVVLNCVAMAFSNTSCPFSWKEGQCINSCGANSCSSKSALVRVISCLDLLSKMSLGKVTMVSGQRSKSASVLLRYHFESCLRLHGRKLG